MLVETYKNPVTNFLSIEKDTGVIIDYILKNQRLKKLLFYTTKDCLQKPDLTEEESLSLVNNNILLSPKEKVSPEVKNYIGISFDSFRMNFNNPEFMNNCIVFDIVCHYDTWAMNNFKLRPYQIAAEIETLMQTVQLSGVGKVSLLGANNVIINNEFAGCRVVYEVVHGEENRKHFISGEEEKAYNKLFDSIFNNDSED